MVRVHLRRRLRRRHVPHDPLPRINSLDPLSAPTTPSVFPSSSLLFFPPPPSPPPSPTDSPPPLLRRPLRPAASLRLSLPPSLFYPTSSSSLPALCVSLSSRTHLPAERGRTCSTVALRPKVLLLSSKIALHPSSETRKNLSPSRDREYDTVVRFSYVVVVHLRVVPSTLVSSTRVCVPACSLELTRNRGNVDGDKWSRLSPPPGGWTDKFAGTGSSRESWNLFSLLAYFRSQAPVPARSSAPLRFRFALRTADNPPPPPSLPSSLSSFTAGHGCASRYSEIARGPRL